MNAPLTLTDLTPTDLISCGLTADQADVVLERLEPVCFSSDAEVCWNHISRYVLTPDLPLALHRLLHTLAFATWDLAKGPLPVWFPDPQKLTHIDELQQVLGLDSYGALHAWSVQELTAFWECMIHRLGICFKTPYSQVIDIKNGLERPEWFVGGQLNIAESCFNAPVDAPAIIFQPEGYPLETWSYGDLRALSNRVANGLYAMGISPGDAVAVALPMTAEAVAIYLGIILAGGVVVGIADSFAPDEIAIRLRIGQAKIVFTQDNILRGDRRLPLYERIVAAGAPPAIVLAAGAKMTVALRPDDKPWKDFLSKNTIFEAVIRQPTDYTNILFSSGTTGDPKAIPWNHITPIKGASDAHLHHDIHPGEVVAWPTNLGWMMGPWLIYAGLVNCGTLALYYGAPTDSGFGRFVQDAQVNMLGVIPSLVRTWYASGCMAGLDWSAIKAFSSTGESANPEDMYYLSALAGYKPIIEYCGGTEIAGGYVAGSLVQAMVPACFSTPTLGLDFVLLDEAGKPTEEGEAFLLPPSIGFSSELLNRDHHQAYYADTPPYPNTILRRHGDRLARLPGGYYRVQGRMDDTMNIGGIKVGSSEIERLLNALKEVRETAAIAVSPPDGGPSLLIVYAVLNPPTAATLPPLLKTMQKVLRHRLNPLFKISDLVITDILPRTASNKIMRRILRDRYSQR